MLWKPLTKSIRTLKSYNAILIVLVESNHISPLIVGKGPAS